MYTLKIKNSRGEIYELTHNRQQYSVVKVTGLTRPMTNINTASAGTQDGEVFSSSHTNRRNIVITLVLEGDIEANRQRLYRIFPAHSPVTVYYRTANRDLYIDGYVEILDGDLYEARTSMQISIICPDPYFRNAAQIAAATNDGTCTINNYGDVAVGFAAEVAVHTEDEPSLTVTTETSETATEMRRHCCILTAVGYASFFGNMDFGTQTVNITINGTLCASGTDYTPDLLTFPDSHKGLWLESLGHDLTNAGVSIEKIIVDGQSITDMRYWESGETDATEYVSIVGVPGWFDEEKDCIVFAYTYGDIGRKLPKAIQKTLLEDGTYRLDVTFFTVETNARIKLWIYHSIGGTDVHDATISRNWLHWSLYSYRSYILSPTVPAHTAMDVFRVYNGTELLESTEYSFQTVTKSDGTTAQFFDLTGDGKINPAVTFEVIKSIAGDDIHDYTQTQIDEGLCIVDGLKMTNTTTGEYMAFPDYPFRDGDKIEISTVGGDLHVRVTESDWMEAGTSLAREVLKGGSFFKLEPGQNAIALTADTNAGYASASFTVQPLYGGV